MREKEELKQKEVKILKCVKCAKEHIFDTLSQKCPECGGALKKETVVKLKYTYFLPVIVTFQNYVRVNITGEGGNDNFLKPMVDKFY